MEIAEIDQVDYSALAGNSSDSSVSDTAPGPARLFHRSPPRRELDAPTTPDDKLVSDVPPTRVLRRTDTNGTRRRRFKFGTFVKRIRRIMAYNVAIPVTLALVVYTIFAQEVLFTSCALIADRYFGWRGNIAGFFLACLSILILPIDFVCEQVARRYEERTTIKVSYRKTSLGIESQSFSLTKTLDRSACNHASGNWSLGNGELGFYLCPSRERPDFAD
jgi:hypothetical protein